jgi:hypothetical protein
MLQAATDELERRRDEAGAPITAPTRFDAWLRAAEDDDEDDLFGEDDLGFDDIDEEDTDEDDLDADADADDEDDGVGEDDDF